MGSLCSKLCNCKDPEDEYTALMNLATKNPFAAQDRSNKEATLRFFNKDNLKANLENTASVNPSQRSINPNGGSEQK